MNSKYRFPGEGVVYDFLSIDVETANESLDSICQIGLAKYQDFQLVETWETLVNPRDRFSELNLVVHGDPTFPEVFEELAKQVEAYPILHHTSFDRTAINRACVKIRLEPPEWQWVDTVRLAR